jgi:glucan phosphoethanolaminetransferase (alkaline phosphatase superfamily)
MRGSDVIILIALVVLSALMTAFSVMIYYKIYVEVNRLLAPVSGYLNETRPLLIWIFLVVYVVSYLVPKFILKENISELFIVSVIIWVSMGVVFTVAVVLKILFAELKLKPVENIEIVMNMLSGLTGAFLAYVEHREYKKEKEYEHNIVKVINVD